MGTSRSIVRRNFKNSTWRWRGRHWPITEPVRTSSAANSVVVPLRLQSRAAGHKLTKLLKEHILVAVNVLVAARSGDKNKLTQAEAAWSANGRQIADFLHAADPSFLSRDAARTMMKVHLNQVILQAVDELKGNYTADARAVAPYIRHILDMADMISSGIIRQFPSRFA